MNSLSFVRSAQHRSTGNAVWVCHGSADELPVVEPRILKIISSQAIHYVHRGWLESSRSRNRRDLDQRHRALTSERAAAAEGFTRMQLHATLAGLPLYQAYGFVPLENVTLNVDGVAIPCVHMTKHIESAVL